MREDYDEGEFIPSYAIPEKDGGFQWQGYLTLENIIPIPVFYVQNSGTVLRKVPEVYFTRKDSD